MKLDTKAYEEKMKKSIASYENELDTVRVGRANANVLNKVTVDYYGTPTQISAMAQITVPDARTMVIQPWDSSTLKNIEKAILASDLGLNPQNDGKCLRILFPMLTEDRRKELSKQVSKMGEDAKVAIRNIRRDAVDKCKDMKKKSEMTEDEQKASEKSVQDLTDKYIKEIDNVTAKKTKDIMAI
ncbi:MAG: ribosome recycling factor [Ruminococcaceae bacterium]|nr:ribosome recycling factor [Oscillospiraceae bacterium]